MKIPNDTIYLISNYNHDIKDSINLSILNRKINDNCDRITLNNLMITQENFHILSKYNIKNITLNFFEQSITLPNNLTHLTFKEYSEFNQPITLPNDLTHLTFGRHFNQSITLPNSLTHLTFGHYFNQPIILPNNLKRIIFGNDFNQKVNLIDETTGKTFHKLKLVEFGHEFRSELLIGPIYNKIKKVSMILNDIYVDKIFPSHNQYDFDNYIIYNINNNEIINIL